MEQQIAEVLESGLIFLPEAVLLTETERDLEKVIFVNQAFERLTGYSLGELGERGLMLLQGPETDAPDLERLLQPTDDEEGRPLDILLYTKDGTPFWDRIKISKVESGNKLFRVQLHSDVTRHKEMEKRFLLVQKREAVSYLVSGLAHDFNNLLTAILVYSGLMEASVKDDVQLQRYVHEVHNSAERAGQLVAQLLALGREERSEPELLDLCELVHKNVDFLKRIVGDDIQLTVECAPQASQVRAQPGRIQQVLLNLAINARDAMPDGGELLIRICHQQAPANSTSSPPKNYVLLLVQDTGAGMNQEVLANIFQPFFSTKAKDKGTGLGLFVVRTIVDQYGGKIEVECEPGRGASFKILLPAAQ